MYGKPILIFILVVASLIGLSFFVDTNDFKHHVFQFLQQPSASPSPSVPLPKPTEVVVRSAIPPCRSLSPLKVYMYDLPRRFNVGMIHHRSSDADETPVTVKTLPPWPKRSGLNSQHSVEYWMMASLLYDGEEEGREAVRISDPELADVFFVPFFSSLSVNTHGRNMTDPETEVDRQLQMIDEDK